MKLFFLDTGSFCKTVDSFGIVRFGIALFVLVVLSSVHKVSYSQTLKAPYDSHVCFDMSMKSCAEEILGFEFERVLSSQRWRILNDGSIGISSKVGPQARQGANGETFGCTDSDVVLGSSFRFNRERKVVFFSADLFFRLSEAILRVHEAEKACNRVFQKYVVQERDRGLQSTLSWNQQNHQKIMSELDHLSWRLTIERDRTLCYSLPRDAQIAECLRRTIMPVWSWQEPVEQSISLASAAASSRNAVLQAQENAREYAWTMLERELLDDSKELSLNLEKAKLDLAQILLMLHFSTWSPGENDSKLRPLVVDGGLVSKGESVLSYRRK